MHTDQAAADYFMLVVFKGTTMAEMEGQKSFVSTSDAEKSQIMKVLTAIGNKYPAFMLQEDGILHCCFKATVKLDWTDPKFFDKLDAVIDHVKANDDLSRFFLPVASVVA